MKCQNLLSGKNKKNMLTAENFTQSFKKGYGVGHIS